MNNNDILRRIRYTFDYSNAKMKAIFALADYGMTREQVNNWLKKDGESEYLDLTNKEMSIFLDGFIIEKRGKQKGTKPVKHILLNNNIIFRKIKIALNLCEEDILAIFQSVMMPISKHELSAFFRHPQQSQYRACQNQFLRAFLQGIQYRFRPMESKHKKSLADRMTKINA